MRPLNQSKRRNILLLNGKEYVVSGGIQEQPASEFATQINQGDQRYDTRQNASFWSMSSWTGGAGVYYGNHREHQGRFYDSSGVDTRFPNQLTLGPLAQQLGTNQSTGNTIAATSRASIVSYKSKDYFALEDKVWKNTAGTLSEVLDSGTTIGTHLTTFIDTSGNEGLWALAAGQRFYTVAAEPTQTSDWTQSAAGVIGRFAFEYDRNLIMLDGITRVGQIATYTSGTRGAAASWTETFPEFRTVNTSLIAGLVFQNRSGDPTPFFALADTTGGKLSGLYSLDFYARKAYPVPLPRTPQRSTEVNESLFGMAVWNGDLYLPDRQNLLRYRADGSVSDLSTDNGVGQGLPSYGTYGFLAPGGSFMYMTMGRSSTWAIAAQSQQGLHPLVKRSNPLRGIAISTLQSPSRVYWVEAASAGTTASIYYIELPVGSENPVNDSTYDYAASGTITTMGTDLGFADLDKILLRMTVDAEGLSASNETVLVEYQVNTSTTNGISDAGSWTTLGTFTSATRKLNWASGAGTVCRAVRFRYTLSRDSGTTTNTPKVRSITLQYLATPDYRPQKQFVIDIGETLAERGSPKADAATIISELKTAYNADTLVTYQYGSEASTYVKVVTYPFVQYDKEDGRSGGRVTVQVLEPLAS